MGSIVEYFLAKLIHLGSLQVETADGGVRTYGDGTGPSAGIKIMDRAAEWALMVDPTLAMGELYMDGRVAVTHGDLYDVLAIGARNLIDFRGPRWIKWLEETRVLTRRWRQRNDRRRARRNIARHYDLNVHLYDLFLDMDRQYSCAYFERPGDTLDQAQLAKKRHIAAKLIVEEGHRVLDIGCGFGGMALYLAEMVGADATGVTLSQEQFAVARKRATDSGLADLAHFALKDYRDVEEQFDRIVS
ncbi:MAG TPA: class I SAM-dependent methyltransferase, partial [Roseiarcus sp.]|nr:class I SAM-dependent methyltransferase [Roseiarcus sp.]